MTNSRPSLSALIERLVRAEVQTMHAYVVQKSAGLVKMDAMENPHRLPERLQRVLGQRLGALALNRYPGSRVDDLRGALMAHAAVPPGFDLMLGNGSDELIALLAMACDVEGASVLAPEPGFVMYGVSARLQGLQYVGVPLTPDFELDEPAMLRAMDRHRPSIVYLAYPNNPSANLWNRTAMLNIIEAAPGLVVIDEAYQPFAGTSFMEQIEQYDNVLLMRTMSKFGLAGVRIGYLVGRSPLIAQINKVRPPYNISVLNAECALFALENAEEFAAQARDVVAQRQAVLESLGTMAGLRAFRSDANMILVRLQGNGTEADPAQEVFGRLKQRGILVKNVSATHPLLKDCLRLTVGTAQENETMLAALKESL